MMVVSFSAFFWVTAAFRPERDPALIQLLTDLGWLCIDLQYACTTLQMVAAALVGLGDKSKTLVCRRRSGSFVRAWRQTMPRSGPMRHSCGGETSPQSRHTLRE